MPVKKQSTADYISASNHTEFLLKLFTSMKKAPDTNSIQLNPLVTVYNNHTGLYINYRNKHWLLLGGRGLNFLEDSQGTFKL